MEELLERIKNLLATKDVTAERTEPDELMFLARTGPLSVRMRITVRKEALIVCAHIPLFVPAHQLGPMCLAISLANWQLRYCRFEIDSTDGELRCRADMPLYGTVPTDELLTREMYAVWNNTERYAAALVDVMTGLAEPAEAIARAEAPEPQPPRRTMATDLTVN